jgi:hypothetical protein
VVQWTGSKWNPFLIWLFANILGFASLGFAILTISGLIARTGVYGTLLFISLPISLAQWIALRYIERISAVWILTVPLGALFVILWAKYVPDSSWGFLGDESTIAMSLFSLIIGSIIGIPQWLLIRKSLNHATLWILGSALGFGLGMAVIVGTNLINHSGILSYVILSLLYSIITGLTLSWLVSISSRSEDSVTVNP